MIPVHKILSRIRWDSEFGNASFELEYEDRIFGMVKIAMDKICEIDSKSFSIQDGVNSTITIPLHRVRNVYRNGDRIWSRRESA